MEISRAQAQELIRLIQENEISKFFEQIDNDKIKAPQINQLRQEFISGKYFHDYYERLQVFINSIANTDFEVILPKYDIFFSFSSKNIEEAQRNVIILRKCGLSVFFSDEDLKNQAGNEFGKKIEKALENSEHFLLCCTPEAMKSHWVDKEYRAFHDHFYMRTDGQRRFFILEGANFDLKLLTLFLRNIQTCASINEIVRILGKKTIEDHLAERKADYQELFGLFFEDKVITNTERKHLQFKQKFLELTDEQVDEVENGVKSEQVQAQLAQEQAEKEKRESKEQELFERTQTTARLAQERLENERIAQEQAEKERLEREKLAKEAQAKRIEEERQMVYVEGGSYQMGYDPNRDGEDEAMYDAEPLHKVTVSSFNMGKYEVTQAEWKAIMGSNPSYNKNCDNCPVEQVSWNDIQDFLKKLNQNTGKKYRLPSEEEWEYAARGGNKSNGYKYAGSNTPSSVAWTSENSGSKTQPVGTKSPNELGIYDMSGNVWELTSSGYSVNYEEPRSLQLYVYRGGSCDYDTTLCRVAFRTYYRPTNRYETLGFRLAHDF